MDDDLKKIKKLTAFARKNGLIHLKVGEIEINLVQGAMELGTPPESSSQETKAEPEIKYSEEEVLFWSAPGSLPEGLQ